MTLPTDRASVPVVPLILGVAGALPFVACSLQVGLGWPLAPRMSGPALYALNIYGAVILAFMGGVQWGLAVANPVAGWRHYGLSVLPSFVAFGGLWVPPPHGLWLLVAGFLALLCYDLWTVSRREAPAWYGRLRVGLTVIVVIALLFAIMLGPF